MSKHLSIKKMMSKEHKLLPEHISQFAVMQTELNDNEACKVIEDLINKCIDDNSRQINIANNCGNITL